MLTTSANTPPARAARSAHMTCGRAVLVLSAALGLAAAVPAPTDQARATVECSVAKTGHLRDCVLLSETPTGAGVGAFALKLVGAYRVPPQDRRIRNGKVVIPLKFKLPS